MVATGAADEPGLPQDPQKLGKGQHRCSISSVQSSRVQELSINCFELPVIIVYHTHTHTAMTTYVCVCVLGIMLSS